MLTWRLASFPAKQIENCMHPCFLFPTHHSMLNKTFFNLIWDWRFLSLRHITFTGTKPGECRAWLFWNEDRNMLASPEAWFLLFISNEMSMNIRKYFGHTRFDDLRDRDTITVHKSFVTKGHKFVGNAIKIHIITVILSFQNARWRQVRQCDALCQRGRRVWHLRQGLWTQVPLVNHQAKKNEDSAKTLNITILASLDWTQTKISC